MEIIANAAELSVPTLYLTFGGKRQILAALILGLKEEVDVCTSARELMDCPDRVELLQQAAMVSTRFNRVAWQLLDVLRAGARAESELATLQDQVGGARFRDQQVIVRRFAAEGVLRAGPLPDRAAAIFWTLTAHDQYRSMVVERDQSEEDFEAWLAQTLCEQLLGNKTSRRDAGSQ